MKNRLNLVRLIAVWLVAGVVAQTNSGRPISAHSCRLLLLGRRGWKMVAAKAGTVVSKVSFGGVLLSYGTSGNRFASVTGIYPHGVRFDIHDIGSGRRRAGFNLSGLAPPPPMMGALEGVVFFGRHSAYFQAWKFVDHGKTLSSSTNWLAKVNLKTGAASQNVLIPLPYGAAMLFQAIAVPKGMVLFCPRCGVPTSARWYTPATAKLVRLPRVVPKRGGLIFVKNYGLLAWGPHGKLQRITHANMSLGDFPSLSIPRGVVNIHVALHGSTPRLACLSWLNMAGQPTDQPSRSALFMYDLKQHKILWRKVFKFPMSVLNTSFRVSANGRVFAFLNWQGKPQVVFYDHPRDRITTVKLPVSGVSLRYNSRVIAVK